MIPSTQPVPPSIVNSLFIVHVHARRTYRWPGSERRIPYDLTYKWKLVSKTNKQAKNNQRH